MRSRRFIRKVGDKSLLQKRYLVLFLYALSLCALIFLCIQQAFSKVVQDQRCNITQFREESFLIKPDRKSTTIHGPSRSGSEGVENSFQHKGIRPTKEHRESKAFQQNLIPSHSNQHANNNMSVPGSTRNSAKYTNSFVQAASSLTGPASFIYLQLFPQLSITAVADSQGNLKEGSTEEHDEPADGESLLEWVHGTDPFLTSADKHLVPLCKVRIQLLRQRVNRRHWADSLSSSATGRGHASREPVVSLTPVESPLLHFPNELLVEEYLPGDNGVNARPDTNYVVPMIASTVAGARVGRVESELAGRGADGTARPTPNTAGGFHFFPQFVSVNHSVSYSQPLIKAIPAEKDTLAPPELVWYPENTCEDMAIRVQLLKIKPPLGSVEGIRQKLQDPTRTDALAASFNLQGVRRLYGFPRREGAVGGMFSNRLILRIPLDGFHYTASIKGSNKDWRSSETGVLPLVFVELDRFLFRCSSPRSQGVMEPRTVGILWFNGSPFSVRTVTFPSPPKARGGDNTNRGSTVQLNFTSSAAATRIYLLPGPTPAEVIKQYYTLSGFPTMPPLMALGYHYHTHTPLTSNATNFMRALNRYFWDNHIPLDSIGLTSPTINQHGTSLTWDHNILREPMRMQVELWYYGRRSLIVRVAPTIPIVQSSPLYHECRRGRHFISMDPDDDTGWVAYTKDGRRNHVIDFVSQSARQWFSGMFKYKRFTQSSNFTFVTLQHAAPVLLGTPDSTLPMSVGHTRGLTHRQVHNVFNTYAAMSVYHGLLRRNIYHRRSFVTSENYYIGAHRFGGVFLQNGFFLQNDVSEAAPSCSQLSSSTAVPPTCSQIAWQLLKDSISDCASMGIMGIPFVGVNIAGRASESEAIWSKLPPQEREELLTRWYQAASIFPLMQTEELLSVSPGGGDAAAPTLALVVRYSGVRDAVRFRYVLLPYLYTSMWRVSEDGSPMLLAPIVQDGDEKANEQEDYAMCVTVGSELVACPCVKPLGSSVPWKEDAKVQLPNTFPDAEYSNYWTGGWWKGGARVPLWPRTVKMDKTWLGRFKSLDHSKSESTNASEWSDLPLFQRVGSIVPTFLALDGQMVSTRAPANYSLTIALPRKLRTFWWDSWRNPDKQILLASGEVYWDDGTKNTQIQSPPQRAQSHKEQASPPEQVYCHVRLECYLKCGTLMVSGTQVSSRCVESLNSLAFTWNNLPPQMDAWKRRLVEQQESIRHAEEAKRNREEDRGFHGSKRKPRHSVSKTIINGSVDDGGQDPNTTIYGDLNTAFSLHYVRFLLASQVDALWLSQNLGATVEPTKKASALTLVVRLTETSEGERIGLPLMKNRVFPLFGIDSHTMGPIDGNRSKDEGKASPWVIAFKKEAD